MVRAIDSPILRKLIWATIIVLAGNLSAMLGIEFASYEIFGQLDEKPLVFLLR